MSTSTEISQDEITALVKANKRIAIRIAQTYNIDAAEAQSLYALAVVEAANRFNPTKNASLKTFAEALYRADLAEAASQFRYGVELNAEGAPDIATDDQGNYKPASRRSERFVRWVAAADKPAPWRSASEEQIAEKLALLPAQLRAFASLIVSGDSVEVASDKLDTSDRNGRYMLAQCLELLLSLDTSAGQGCLELPAFTVPARPVEPKAKKSRLPSVDDLPGIQQLGLF